MGGGLPISALIGRSEILDHPQVGGMGGTYGGNPLACAASLAVIEAFEQENILGKAEAMGAAMRQGLDELAGRFACIGQVRGLGPMLAMEMVKDRKSKEPDPELTGTIIAKAREKGLIIMGCGNFGNVIRILAPLTTSADTLDLALGILTAAFEEAGAG